jgi:sulfite exporter TauE/SafE
MNPQQIIVYHSQSEAVLDQAIINGQLMPIIFGLVAFFVLFLGLVKAEQVYRRRSNRWSYSNFTNAWLAVSGLVGVLTIYLTWI